jgi:rhodanese-related sulfurtransferase
MDDRPAPPRRRSAAWVLIAAAALYALVAGFRHLADTAPRIEPTSLAERLGQPDAPLLLDVRSREEYVRDRIPGALNIHYTEVARRLGEVGGDRAREVVVYCETGVRARVARGALADGGFTRVVQLRGDIEGWRRLGLPLERGRPR